MVSLHNDTAQDAALEASAHSVKPEDGQQALGLLQAIVDSASPNASSATDYSLAGSGLQNTEAEKQAVAHDKEQLLRAATSCAAESRIWGRFALRTMEDWFL